MLEKAFEGSSLERSSGSNSSISSIRELQHCKQKIDESETSRFVDQVTRRYQQLYHLSFSRRLLYPVNHTSTNLWEQHHVHLRRTVIQRTPSPLALANAILTDTTLRFKIPSPNPSRTTSRNSLFRRSRICQRRGGSRLGSIGRSSCKRGRMGKRAM